MRFAGAIPMHFNPRSPHGERLSENITSQKPNYFNPRSPHGERRKITIICKLTQRFQPTLPARGATRGTNGSIAAYTISTHAPRTGSDLCPFFPCAAVGDDFNPRSPHGERLILSADCSSSEAFQPTLPARGATWYTPDLHDQRKRFQPTLPARGATSKRVPLLHLKRISTHAPRTGSDVCTPNTRSIEADFNPRSPHGERRGNSEYRKTARRNISTHAPRTGSDVALAR